nr:hypothetical protein [Salmonid herpesvirus 1]
MSDIVYGRHAFDEGLVMPSDSDSDAETEDFQERRYRVEIDLIPKEMIGDDISGGHLCHIVQMKPGSSVANVIAVSTFALYEVRKKIFFLRAEDMPSVVEASVDVMGFNKNPWDALAWAWLEAGRPNVAALLDKRCRRLFRDYTSHHGGPVVNQSVSDNDMVDEILTTMKTIFPPTWTLFFHTPNDPIYDSALCEAMGPAAEAHGMTHIYYDNTKTCLPRVTVFKNSYAWPCEGGSFGYELYYIGRNVYCGPWVDETTLDQSRFFPTIPKN